MLRVRHPLLAALCLAFALTASAQVLKVEELNTRQLEQLDRAKTVVLIPGGILEEHGPYAPSGTDNFVIMWQTQRLAERLVKDGRTVLLFPQLVVGASGANDIANKFRFPGTFAMRTETVRRVYMDLAGELGEQGFKWIFLMHLHGAPRNHIALNDAGDFFHDVYGGRMVHLYGLADVFFYEADTKPPDKVVQEDGFTVHAGFVEQSWLKFVRPDLSVGVESAPTVTGKNMADLVRLGRQPDWPGYFGAPRYANAAYGAYSLQGQSEKIYQVATAILNGADPAKMTRMQDLTLSDKAELEIDRAILAFEAEVEQKQNAWLAKRRQK